MNIKLCRSVLIAAAAVLFFVPVALHAQDVNVDYDHNANFGQFHTFSWKQVQTPNQLWDQRVQDSVNEQLQKAGWQHVQSGGDVVLSAIGSTQEQTQLRTFYNGPGWGGWRWGGFGTSTTTQNTVQNGTLVVDMFDANRRQLLWRGVASDTVSDRPSRNMDRLQRATERMFRNFPPETKEEKK